MDAKSEAKDSKQEPNNAKGIIIEEDGTTIKSSTEVSESKDREDGEEGEEVEANGNEGEGSRC